MSPLKPMLALDASKLLAPGESPSSIPAALRYPLIAQPKLDGIRVTIQDGRVLTRSLKEVPNREIVEALSDELYEGLDGELIVGDPREPDCYRKTASFVMAAGKPGANWSLWAFDTLDPGVLASERLLRVEERVGLVNWTDAPVLACPHRVVRSAAELSEYESLLLDAGEEGVILRSPGSYYKHGRAGKTTRELVKLKRFEDFEARVVGVYEEQHNANARFENELGRGARSSAKAGKVGKGTLGGLVLVALNGPHEGVEFRCGTGFDAAERSTLWLESLPGRVAKVKCFPSGAKDKPRHPVFVGWRHAGDL